MSTFEVSIFRVMKGDAAVGAAFLVSDRLVVTCAHVVNLAGAEVGGKITLRLSDGKDIEANVEPEFWRDANAEDISILRLNEPLENIQPVILGSSSGTKGHNFSTFGFPKASRELTGRGEIVGDAILDEIKLLQLDSRQVTPGFSGAPIFDEITKRVVGMVVAIMPPDEYQRLGTTAFAIPSEIIREICPNLQILDICPYRSLDIFNEEDAPFFFGRERVVQKMIDSLKREPRFLAVLGPSGSGKSSAVRAGLSPILKQGKVPGSHKWSIITIRPANQPFDQLANVGFVNPQVGLVNSVKTWLADHPDKTRLVLVIDQFEEVLVSKLSNIRQIFIDELSQLLNSPLAITLILTLRDDFYSRFLQNASIMVGWLERGLINIPPVLEQDELQAMVFKPATSVGLTFDDGLVDIIIADACETDRAKKLARSTILPLLEFALTQLWDMRKDGQLTHEAYKSIGGTTGSLSQWADQAYYSLSPEERKISERIFCELVHLGDEGEQIPDTRRVVPIETLVSSQKSIVAEQVIDKLIRARLLSVGGEYKTQKRFVEIIHDALLREWALLGRWIDNFRHREQIARERRRRMIILGLIVGLLVMVVLASAAWLQREIAISSKETAIAEANARGTAQADASRQAQIALARQLIAQAQSIEATRNSKQITAVLLAIRSMEILPSSQASQILLGNLTAHAVYAVNHSEEGDVRAVAFSPDSQLIASAGGKTIRILETATGKEIARLQHDDLVYSVAFSPDGAFLASGGRDQTVRIWDSLKGDEIHHLMQDGEVRSVAFSPDGNYVVAGGFKSIRIWEVNSGTEISLMKINTGPVSAVTFSQDGEFVASADAKTARVWNATTGEEVFRKKSDEAVNSVAFSPDGTYLVSSCDPLSACVWDIANNIEIARMIHEGTVTSAAFSPDGNYVVSGSRDNTARVWETMTGKEQARMTHDSSVLSVSFSPKGFYVVSSSSDFTARVWSSDAGVELARKTHESLIYTAIFSPDGHYLASGGADRVMRVWTALPTAEIARMTHAGRVYDAALSPDGKLAISGSSDGTARLWELETDQEIHRITHDGTVFAVAFSTTGKYVVSGGGSIVSIWETRTGKEIAHIQHGTNVYSVAFSLDGIYVASGSDDSTARVWNATTGAEVVHFTHEGNISSVIFSSDGQYVISGGGSTACVWSVLTGVKATCLTHDGSVYSVAISPNGKYVISGDDTTARVWNAMTGEHISSVSHQSFVYSVAFSPDGEYVASGGLRTAVVWDPITGKKISQMIHDGIVNTVAFSQDGIYVISGDDKTARIWEAVTGKEIARMNHNNLVKTAAISSDGKYAISGGVDKTARVWLWHAVDLIRQTCDNLPRNLTRDEWNTYLEGQPYQAICPELSIEPEEAIP